MATEVLVERSELDDGIVMIYKRFGSRVRMAFDPRRIQERTALKLLGEQLGADTVDEIHRTGA